MNMQKMGCFLKELRMEHHLTQEQLGEKVGVTNKTVSRWETGKYMPSVECLELLSGLYEISINEIITGERLSTEEFKDSAEGNLKSVLHTIEKENARYERRMKMLLLTTSLLAMCAIILLPVEPLVLMADKVRAVLVIFFIVAIAVIANVLNMANMAAILSRKFK